MNIDVILRSPSAFHRWYSTGEGKVFQEWIFEWQKQVLKQLGSQDQPVEMYRAQGRLEVLNRLAGLKNEVDQYQKGLLSGRFKKIE